MWLLSRVPPCCLQIESGCLYEVPKPKPENALSRPHEKGIEPAASGEIRERATMAYAPCTTSRGILLISWYHPTARLNGGLQLMKRSVTAPPVLRPNLSATLAHTILGTDSFYPRNEFALLHCSKAHKHIPLASHRARGQARKLLVSNFIANCNELGPKSISSWFLLVHLHLLV